MAAVIWMRVLLGFSAVGMSHLISASRLSYKRLVSNVIPRFCIVTADFFDRLVTVLLIVVVETEHPIWASNSIEASGALQECIYMPTTLCNALHRWLVFCIMILRQVTRFCHLHLSQY